MKRWAFLGLTILGCGGASAPAARAPLQAAAHAASAADELSEKSDLANAALPPGTSLWCHLPSPGQDVPVVAALTNLGAFLDLNELLEQRFGAELAATIELQRPFDLLAFKGANDDVSIAAGIGVEDVPAFAAHVAKDFTLARMSAGRFRLVPVGTGRTERRRYRFLSKTGAGDGDEQHCEVWQGGTGVGARLICGSSERVLELSGPFLLSPERVNAKTSNLHLEVPHDFIAGTMRDLAKKDEGQADGTKSASERAGEKLGQDEAFAMFNAMQSLSFDVTLKQSSIEVSEQLELSGVNGFLTSLIAGRTGPHPLVPSAFWSLPADSDFAFYGEGIDEHALREAWRKLAPQLYALAVDEKAAKPGQTAEFSRLVEEAFLHAGSWELAFGDDLSASAALVDDAASKLKAKPPKMGAHEPPIELARANQKIPAWALIGVEIGDRDEIAAIRAVITAGDKLPTLKDSGSESEQRSHEKSREQPLKHPGKLPKNSVHVVFETVPNKKYVPKDGHAPALPLTQHLVAVQQNGQLWAAISNDEDLAVKRLGQILSPDAAQSVGADAELKSLSLPQPAALGYLTIAGAVGFFLSLDTPDELTSAQKSLSAVLSSPHKGGTRLRGWLTADGSSPRKLALHVSVPADAIADLLHLSLSSLADDP